MSEGTKSPTSTEFSVLVLITFLLKIVFPGDEGQVKFLQAQQLICACLKINTDQLQKNCLSCNNSVLNCNYS